MDLGYFADGEDIDYIRSKAAEEAQKNGLTGFDFIVFGDRTQFEGALNELWNLPTGEGLITEFAGKGFGTFVDVEIDPNKRAGGYSHDEDYITWNPTVEVAANVKADWRYCPSAIIFAHELIHSYQKHGEGRNPRSYRDPIEPEKRAVGEGRYESLPYTERKLRADWRNYKPYTKPDVLDENGKPKTLPADRPTYRDTSQ